MQLLSLPHALPSGMNICSGVVIVGVLGVSTIVFVFVGAYPILNGISPPEQMEFCKFHVEYIGCPLVVQSC